MTEMITGIDLIQEQIKVAQGGRLPFKQEDIVFKVSFSVSASGACGPASSAPWTHRAQGACWGRAKAGVLACLTICHTWSPAHGTGAHVAEIEQGRLDAESFKSPHTHVRCCHINVARTVGLLLVCVATCICCAVTACWATAFYSSLPGCAPMHAGPLH